MSQIEQLKRANQHQSKVKGKRRELRAQTPQACEQCQAGEPPVSAQPTEVISWRQRKSQAGRPKTLNSAEVACRNEECDYHRISDAEVHAIVGNGKRGQCERIQQWHCQACGSAFSARVGTPLHRLKTESKHMAEGLTALAEGVICPQPAVSSVIIPARSVVGWVGLVSIVSSCISAHFARSWLPICNWMS